MDVFSIHLDPLPRRFPGGLPIASVGYIPLKRTEIHHDFGTFNYSFILSGRGFFEVDGHRFAVQAPCVITQWPGPDMHYGPDADGWEELFLIYRPDREQRLRESRFLRDRRRWWRLGDVTGLQAPLDELFSLIPEADRQIDRLDRCCERLLLESQIGADRPARLGPEEAVHGIRRLVERDCTVEYDFDALARAQGLSPSHFRRLWGRLVGVPPARHVMQLRLRRACQELVDGDREIGRIARDLGFADPLYFARRFKAFTGDTASGYRRRYRESLSRRA